MVFTLQQSPIFNSSVYNSYSFHLLFECFSLLTFVSLQKIGTRGYSYKLPFKKDSGRAFHEKSVTKTKEYCIGDVKFSRGKHVSTRQKAEKKE